MFTDVSSFKEKRKWPTNELLHLDLLLLQTTGVDFVKKANFALFSESALITILQQAYSEFPIHLILNKSWLTLITLSGKTELKLFTSY